MGHPVELLYFNINMDLILFARGGHRTWNFLAWYNSNSHMSIKIQIKGDSGIKPRMVPWPLPYLQYHSVIELGTIFLELGIFGFFMAIYGIWPWMANITFFFIPEERWISKPSSSHNSKWPLKLNVGIKRDLVFIDIEIIEDLRRSLKIFKDIETFKDLETLWDQWKP